MLAIETDLSVLPLAPNNTTEGAALYSTLASVLCGFAFTAIVLLVVTWLGNSTGARRVLATVGSPLVASFFGLLIMSVAYAAEATNTSNNGFVASENTVLAVGFTGVGALLFYTVVLMLDAAGEVTEGRSGVPDKAAKTDAAKGSGSVIAAAKPAAPRLWEVARFTRISTCVMNLLIMGIGYDSASLYENYEYGMTHSFTPIDAFGLGLLSAEAMILLWACWPGLRTKSSLLFRGLPVILP